MINFFSQFDVTSFINIFINSGIFTIYLVILTVFLFCYWNLIGNTPWKIIWLIINNNMNEIINNSLGKNLKSKGYRTLLLSLFLVILSLNLLGMIPYVFTYSAHVSVTIGLSSLIIISCYAYSLYFNGINYFSHFTPYKTPMILAIFLVIVETISSLARILSLGLRLAANITAGHLLLAMLSSFSVDGLLTLCPLIIWILVPILLIIKLFVIILEIGIAFVQAYVFVLLTTLFISESLN